MSKQPLNRKRLIDSLEMPANPQRMYVFVVGLCRTGTTSLREALQIFGWRGHGMKEAMEDNQGKYWREALRLKFRPNDPANTGMKPYGPLEFRKLLADYNGITDLPAAHFIEEIREAFPDAKIVVSNRNVLSWKKSMDQTIFRVMNWTGLITLATLTGNDTRDNMLNAFECVYHIAGGDVGVHRDSQRMTDGFQKHYDVLRQNVPADQRLEYNVSEGWEPLCKFLEVDIPAQPFPHANDSAEFVQTFRTVWWIFLGIVTAKAAAVGAVSYGGYAALRYFQRL